MKGSDAGLPGHAQEVGQGHDPLVRLAAQDVAQHLDARKPSTSFKVRGRGLRVGLKRIDPEVGGRLAAALAYPA